MSQPLKQDLVTLYINFVPLSESITRRNLFAEAVEVPTERDYRQIIVASAYFPGEDRSSPPEEEPHKLMQKQN